MKFPRLPTRTLSLLLVLASLLILIAIRAPSFFQRRQIISLLCAAAPLLIVSCGMAVVMICRQIDISIGSQFAICSVLLGLLVRAHWPVPLAAVIVLSAGALLGAFNAVAVAGLGLPSIVVTLATLVTWREALRWWRQGEFVRDLPPGFQWFGLTQASGEMAILLIGGLILVTVTVAMKQLSVGRHIYAVGSSAEAARLAGLRPRRIAFLVFVLMGIFTSVAAIVNAVRFADVDPKTGTGLELTAIAAAVVGGVAVSGGRGDFCGVFLAVLLLSCIAPMLVFINLPPQWEKALQGFIILLAVSADGLRTRRRQTARV